MRWLSLHNMCQHNKKKKHRSLTWTEWIKFFLSHDSMRKKKLRTILYCWQVSHQSFKRLKMRQQSEVEDSRLMTKCLSISGDGLTARATICWIQNVIEYLQKGKKIHIQLLRTVFFFITSYSVLKNMTLLGLPSCSRPAPII